MQIDITENELQLVRRLLVDNALEGLNIAFEPVSQELRDGLLDKLCDAAKRGLNKETLTVN